MMTIAVAAIALLSPQAEKWDLKPTYSKDYKIEYKMDFLVSMDSNEHRALFTSTLYGQDKDTADTYPVKVSWHDIELDGRPADELPVWNLKLNSSGAIQGAGGDTEEAYGRMMAPFFFAYPKTAVGPGDKWEVKAGPKDATTKSYEVKGSERLDNDDVLKITERFTDNEGMKGDGTWWVNKAGKPLKFEMKVTDWFLAFEGGDQKLQVVAKGSVVKG